MARSPAPRAGEPGRKFSSAPPVLWPSCLSPIRAAVRAVQLRSVLCSLGLVWHFLFFSVSLVFFRLLSLDPAVLVVLVLPQYACGYVLSPQYDDDSELRGGRLHT